MFRETPKIDNRLIQPSEQRSSGHEDNGEPWDREDDSQDNEGKRIDTEREIEQPQPKKSGCERLQKYASGGLNASNKNDYKFKIRQLEHEGVIYRVLKILPFQ